MFTQLIVTHGVNLCFIFWCHVFPAFAAPMIFAAIPLVNVSGIFLPLWILRILQSCPLVAGNLCHGASLLTRVSESPATSFTSLSAAEKASAKLRSEERR